MEGAIAILSQVAWQDWFGLLSKEWRNFLMLLSQCLLCGTYHWSLAVRNSRGNWGSKRSRLHGWTIADQDAEFKYLISKCLFSTGQMNERPFILSFFWANIHLSVSANHVCSFVTGLLHSGCYFKVPYFLYPFLCWGTSQLFPTSAFINKAAMNIVEHVSLLQIGASFGISPGVV